MISKLFEALYLKVYVNIVVKKHSSIVYTEVCSKDEIIQSSEKRFETTTVNEKMAEFISEYTKESPFHYVSVLDNSTSQGAIGVCGKTELNIYKDLSDYKHICFDNKWTYYTALSDIKRLESNYEMIGLDFIFSPFLVVRNFFKDKIDSHMAMYVLIEENHIALSVFEHSELLFAQHIDLESEKETEELIMDEITENLGIEEIDNIDLDENVDLEDVDVIDDLDDGLDEFGDIEDLDSIDDIDDFSDSKDLEEELLEEDREETMSMGDVEAFNDDYQRFTLIQNAVNYFYKDEKFNSKFIETVYIADAVGIGGDLKRYFEEEMFLNVYVRQIDLGAEVCDMAKAESK